MRRAQLPSQASQLYFTPGRQPPPRGLDETHFRCGVSLEVTPRLLCNENGHGDLSEDTYQHLQANAAASGRPALDPFTRQPLMNMRVNANKQRDLVNFYPHLLNQDIQSWDHIHQADIESCIPRVGQLSDDEFDQYLAAAQYLKRTKVSGASELMSRLLESRASSGAVGAVRAQKFFYDSAAGRARSLMKEGKLDEAEKLLNEFDDAESVYPFMILFGEIFRRKGQYDQAVIALLDCIESARDKIRVARAHMELSRVYSDVGDAEQAQAHKVIARQTHRESIDETAHLLANGAYVTRSA